MDEEFDTEKELVDPQCLGPRQVEEGERAIALVVEGNLKFLLQVADKAAVLAVGRRHELVLSWRDGLRLSKSFFPKR